MVRRIKNLEQQNAELQDSAKEKDIWIESIFNALANDERGPEVLEKLRQGQTYEQVAEWLGRPPFEDVGRLSATSEYRLSDIAKKYEEAMNLDATPENIQSLQWTDVTSNEALTHHLMALYFAWVHPVHMVFSETHFMSSYRSGDRTYCTPSLVNAICGMGCFYLVDEGGDETVAKDLSCQFLMQVHQDIAMEDQTKPIFATTYAILFLIELSAGQARKASSHLRLAVESLHRANVAGFSSEAFEITSWGIHTLNTAWAGFTYQKPSMPMSPRAIVFKDVELDKEGACWQPYRVPQDNAMSEIPSHAIRTAKELARLNQIILETINVYCGSCGRVTAKSILYLYRRYLQWKEALPPTMRIDESDSQPLPHVYSLHAHYHVALCQLFQPLLDYDRFSQVTLDHIRNITTQAAEDGIKVLRAYQKFFSARYQVPLQSFCLVHLCDTLVRRGRSDVDTQSVVTFCLEMLHLALPGFVFIGPLQAMFCQMILEQRLPLPKDVNKLMGGRTQYGLEEFLDACERVTYAQPIDVLLERLDPLIADKFEGEWHDFIEAHGGNNSDITVDTPFEGADEQFQERQSNRNSPSSRSMQINSLVNP